MIYVLNSKGEPLMPTGCHGRIRHLLRDKKAFIVN
ncbi:MAG: RRXRR domain-containing protein, partial [Succinivibrionaceae bacterium]|nr:RRXRR domain-containing protein [Succinivibrionaceae bacterium]